MGWCAPTPGPRGRGFSNTPISRCGRAPVRPDPRRSPNPNPSENAAAARSVVPRRLDFHRNASAINRLRKSGVQVGLEREGGREREGERRYEIQTTKNYLVILSHTTSLTPSRR